jgi:hypothetical protein
MRTIRRKIVILVLGFLLVVLAHTASGTHTALARQYDIAEIMMNKYKLSVGDDEFTVFYRLSVTGGLSEDTHEDLAAKIDSIEVNHERQSLIIKLDGVAQTDIMSMRIPKELISADGRQLALFIDGKEIRYEWSVKGEYNNLIFIVPAQTGQLEIVGTRVIPEFTSGLAILAITSSVAALLWRYVYS